MPRTAARLGVPGGKNRLLRPTRSLVCGTALALSATLSVVPIRQLALAQSTGNPVLLPTEAGHTLDAGPAGWTSSAQVTATGCAAGDCPVATGVWDGTSASGGVLRNTVSGTAGHSGQATVTWRSPFFVVPAASGAASFSLSLASSYSWTPAPGIVPTYSVHLVDSGTGALTTIVDSNPVPTPEHGWSTIAPLPLPAGALLPGAVGRLEIAVRFPVSSRTGDAAVLLDDPTLFVDQLDTPLIPAATAPIGTGVVPGHAGDAAVPGSAASTPPAIPGGEGAPDDSGSDDRCAAGDVAVVGAGATGRRLSIAGTASGRSGAVVDLLSVDGWLLGHAAVDGQGHFNALLPEPAGSSGTRRVFARLPDGRRSAEVAVQRRNVLRAVRTSSRGLVVEGTVDPSLTRRGRLAVDAELPGTNPCDPTTTVHATKVTVNRRTGSYRAIVPTSGLDVHGSRSTTSSLGEPALVRARVTRIGPGKVRVVARSQVIFGPKSDRRGT